MPTYQYACTECGHQLEAVQSFSDDPLTICTECQGRLRKVFSAVGVVFKGSGFYRTDSRSACGRVASNGAPKSEGSSNGTPVPAASGSNGSSAPKTTSTPAPATT